MARNRAWAIASAVYHWITGISGLLTGLLALAFSGLILDLLNRVLFAGTFQILPPAFGGLTLPNFIAPSTIGLVSTVVTGLLLAIAAITAAVGLIGRRSWAGGLSIAIHAMNAILMLIAFVIWLGTGWLGASFIPFLFLLINVVLIVGLLLPAGSAQSSQGPNGGTAPSVAPTGPVGVAPTPFGPVFAYPVAGPALVPQAAMASAGFGWSGGVAPTEVAAPQSGVLAWLIEGNGPRAGRQYRLAAQVTIGRDPTCADLVIDDAKVSSTHARVRFEQGQYVIYDLGSTNKTFVNGQQVTSQVLKDGDQIGLGPNSQLIFKMV